MFFKHLVLFGHNGQQPYFEVFGGMSLCASIFLFTFVLSPLIFLVQHAVLLRAPHVTQMAVEPQVFGATFNANFLDNVTLLVQKPSIKDFDILVNIV
eukprot:12157818-Ditylum_brightwellii.AAC.1